MGAEVNQKASCGFVSLILFPPRFLSLPSVVAPVCLHSFFFFFARFYVVGYLMEDKAKVMLSSECVFSVVEGLTMPFLLDYKSFLINSK